MARAVIVSDMLRGFMEEGYPLYCGARARRIIPKIQKLLEQELAKGSKIFYLCDQHDRDDPEFAIFPPHAIESTVESEIIPELSKYRGKIIPKKTYSLFYGTTLEKELKELKPETVVICGVCTHICILHGVKIVSCSTTNAHWLIVLVIQEKVTKLLRRLCNSILEPYWSFSA